MQVSFKTHFFKKSFYKFIFNIKIHLPSFGWLNDLFDLLLKHDCWLSTYNLQKVWSLIDLRHFLSFLDLQQCCCTLGPNKRKLVQMRKICSVSAFFIKVFFFVVLHCLGESMGFFFLFNRSQICFVILLKSVMSFMLKNPY